MGQKLYLDGKVSKIEEIITNWYTYTVKDPQAQLQSSHKSVYTTCPKLHILTKMDKTIELYTQFMKLSKCNCHYFSHYGYCHHIISVMFSMDDEYRKEYDTSKISRINFQTTPNSNSLWDQITNVDKESSINNYRNSLKAFYEHNWSSTQIIKHLSSLTKDMERYQELVDYYNNKATIASTDYSLQKKLIKLITNPYLGSYKPEKWLLIHLEFADNIHPNNQEDLLKVLFVNYFSGVYSGTTKPKELLKTLQQYSSRVGEDVLETIAESFYLASKSGSNSYSDWIDFCKITLFLDPLINSLDKLDPLTLLSIAGQLPEQQDLIDIKISNQVRIWSDFMPVGEYSELLEVLDKWQTILGRTDNFTDTVKYIIDFHRKKSSLVKELKEYI